MSLNSNQLCTIHDLLPTALTLDTWPILRSATAATAASPFKTHGSFQITFEHKKYCIPRASRSVLSYLQHMTSCRSAGGVRYNPAWLVLTSCIDPFKQVGSATPRANNPSITCLHTSDTSTQSPMLDPFPQLCNLKRMPNQPHTTLLHITPAFTTQLWQTIALQLYGA